MYAPDDFNLDDGPEYVAVKAMLSSACPFCPNEIIRGDAITQRKPGEAWCHIGCAYAQDEEEADPFTLVRERRQWHSRPRRRMGERRMPRARVAA